jgi:predicted nucleotidyltransferase
MGGLIMERAKRVPGIREAKRIVKILATANPRRIIVFGSVASGKTRATSDIDLCVLVDSLGGRPAFRLKQDLYQLLWDHQYDFPVDIDVRVYAFDDYHNRLQHGDPFLREIAIGQVLYERE